MNVVQNGQAQTLEPILNAQAPSRTEVGPTGSVDLGAQKAGTLNGQLRAALKDQGANDELIVTKALKALNEKIVSQRTYVGELLDFGAAHYKFDKDEKESYFVKLKTATGEQTVWGVDLSRAMEDLQAKGPVNGPIILAFQGAKAVKTSVRTRDAQGKPAGWESAVVNRNEWFAQSLADAYAFQPNGQSSYYVRLSTENGEVLIWGADLARAVRNQVLEGQTVVVAYRGLESVPDADGPTTRRNDWLVAPLKTLHEDAQQGVVHAASTQPKVDAPDFSFMNKRDRQSMEVLAQAMRLAKVPDEIATDTLKQAQGLIQSGPKPVNTSTQKSQAKVKSATPTVQRKAAGPSL
jgi:hypothetical protein